MAVDLPAHPYGFVHLKGPVSIDRDPVQGELLVRLAPQAIVAVTDLAGWD